MNTKKRRDKKLSEQDIDQIVIREAGDDSAWEAPVYVHRAELALVSIPGELAARAAFLARLHRQSSVEEWLAQIIQERVEVEEAAFADVKRDLAGKTD